MSTAVQLEEIAFGKLAPAQSTTAESCVAEGTNRRLCILDRNSGLNFLIDTGAHVSVLPINVIKRKSTSESVNFALYAANGTKIDTYGTHTMVLDLKLRRDFRWTFIIAKVKQPILGADFISHFGLLVNLSERKLIDNLTQLNVITSIKDCITTSIKTIDDNHPYRDVLSMFPDVLKPASFKEPPQHPVLHYIETTGPPVHARARPLPPERYNKVKQEFIKMQEMGICRPSQSEWASPLHVVPKKNGDIRPCGDYRQLNAITKPDRYPVPRLHDFTYNLAGKKIFSRIDVNRSFHYIPINPADVPKTSIITPFGLFEFTRMTFGLRNAAQSFQRFMHHTVLQGMDDFLFCFIDDVIIGSQDETTHKNHLKLLFDRLNKFGLTINMSKCCFGVTELDFVGFHVSHEGIRPQDDKVSAIKEFPKPKTVSELRRFLGMVNFYRKHIPHAVQSQALLSKYLHNAKKNDKTPVVWTPDTEAAFQQCKTQLENAVTLSYPYADATLSLVTDASNTCAGAVLQQLVKSSWKPLGFFSKRLSETQQRYSTYDRELLAIYMAIKHFRKLFEGRPLTIYTDHRPLVHAFTKIGTDSETPRRTRQLLFISEFSTDIRYVSGDDNIVADALSRVDTIACPTTIDYELLAESQKHDDYIVQYNNTSNISTKADFKQIYFPLSNCKIYCEISQSKARPYLTKEFRRIAFDNVHNISHPGIRATRRMITDRFFWPNMNTDIGKWAKTCISCQKAKVTRHCISEYGTFQNAGRFEHIHVDIIGPLPISTDGYRYCVTIIDRGTRWPEAYPIRDITAETVAKIIYEGWITRYGCPIRLTSDQGRQFESHLFIDLLKYLGVHKVRTTSYHPQANGIVERWHRTLKASLMAKLNTSTWIEELPTVLYGLRAAGRSDNGVSAAEYTFGKPLRLPGEFFETSEPVSDDASDVTRNIRNSINKLRPISSTHHNNREWFVHEDLQKCSHVFARDDSVRKPLKTPYDGPFKVIKRGTKVFTIQLPNRQTTISIDRLKPAYLLHESSESVENVASSNTASEHKVHDPVIKKSRSGRIIKPPVRFKLD